MDDITVNFDPERAAQAVRAFCELCREHQVIVFTCHPETMELFSTSECNGACNQIALTRDETFAGRVSHNPIVAPVSQDIDCEALADFVLDTLANGGLGISDLGNELKVGKEVLRPVLETLRGRGKVDVTGHGRSATWGLVG